MTQIIRLRAHLRGRTRYHLAPGDLTCMLYSRAALSILSTLTHLRYTVGAHKAADLDGLEPRVKEALNQLALDGRRHSRWGEVLESVARRYLDDAAVSGVLYATCDARSRSPPSLADDSPHKLVRG